MRVRDNEDQDHQSEETKHVVEAVLHSVFGCQHVSSRLGALWSVLEGSREVERCDYEI